MIKNDKKCLKMQISARKHSLKVVPEPLKNLENAFASIALNANPFI